MKKRWIVAVVLGLGMLGYLLAIARRTDASSLAAGVLGSVLAPGALVSLATPGLLRLRSSLSEDAVERREARQSDLKFQVVATVLIFGVIAYAWSIAGLRR